MDSQVIHVYSSTTSSCWLGAIFYFKKIVQIHPRTSPHRNQHAKISTYSHLCLSVFWVKPPKTVSVIPISNIKWRQESIFGILSLWTHLHSNETISDFRNFITFWTSGRPFNLGRLKISIKITIGQLTDLLCADACSCYHALCKRPPV